MPARHNLYTFSAILLLASLGAPSTGHAQCPSAKLEVYQFPKTTIDMKKFFNMANCKCKTKVEVYLTFSALPSSGCSDRFIVVSGQNCYNTSTQEVDTTKCTVLQSEIKFNQVNKIEFPVGNLPAGQIMGNTSCSEIDSQTSGVFVYTKNSSGTWNQTPYAKVDIPMDTQGPTAPVKDTAPLAGENQVEISFKSAYSASSGDGGTGATKEKDLKGYQVLCAKLDKEGGTVQGPGLATAKEAIYDNPERSCPTTKVDGGTVADASVSDAKAADGGSGSSLPPGPTPRAAEAGVTDSGAKDAGVKDSAVKDSAVKDSAVKDAGAPDVSSPFPDSGQSSTGDTVDTVPISYVCSNKISTEGSETIKDLSNGTAYRFWIVAVDDLGNASKLILLGDATPQQEEDLWERYKRSGGGAKGEYCFVATAAYGDYDHPHVLVLRDFRDQVLLASAPGRAVVNTYYRVGEGPARWLAGSDGWRTAARAALWPVTLAAGAVVYTSAWQKGLALMCLGVAVMLVGLRARRRQPKDSKGGQS